MLEEKLKQHKDVKHRLRNGLERKPRILPPVKVSKMCGIDLLALRHRCRVFESVRSGRPVFASPACLFCLFASIRLPCVRPCRLSFGSSPSVRDYAACAVLSDGAAYDGQL